jgi:KaiC/GvpD/RAD55 family RecA-like ATPase
MGLRIPVNGLDRHIGEIPEGSLVLIEGPLGPAKSAMALGLSAEAAGAGWSVVFVTSRSEKIIAQALESAGAKAPKAMVLAMKPASVWNPLIDDATLLVVDSYSYIVQDVHGPLLRQSLEETRNLCRQHGAIAFLTLEPGMLSAQVEHSVEHIADGIISLHTREGPDGLVRFLRIPAWMDGTTVDTNVNYTIERGRMTVDTRARVV